VARKGQGCWGGASVAEERALSRRFLKHVNDPRRPGIFIGGAVIDERGGGLAG